MVAAERNQLFADGATPVGLALAGLGVADDALHLVAGREAAVGVAALAGVHQALDAPLDAQLARFDRVVGGAGGLGGTAIKVEAQPLHFVEVALLLVAGHAQVKVVAHGAVVARLYALLAVVARVNELVLALGEVNH